MIDNHDIFIVHATGAQWRHNKEFNKSQIGPCLMTSQKDFILEKVGNMDKL